MLQCDWMGAKTIPKKSDDTVVIPSNRSQAHVLIFDVLLLWAYTLWWLSQWEKQGLVQWLRSFPCEPCLVLPVRKLADKQRGTKGKFDKYLSSFIFHSCVVSKVFDCLHTMGLKAMLAT